MNSISTHSLSLIRKIHFFDEIGSTNDLAIELAGDEAMHGTLIIAKRQNKARGRQHRLWITDDGDIALSLLLMDSLPARSLHLFTVSTALAVVKTLNSFGLQGFIKWPNDVVTNHADDTSFLPYCGKYRKIGGILTETIAKGMTIKASIIGVGINISKKHGLFPNIPHAIGVDDLVPDVDREGFLNIFLPLWDELLIRALDEKGHPDLMAAYRTLCITLDTEVTLQDISGRAIGIDNDGALMVQDGKTVHKIYGGEVCHRC